MKTINAKTPKRRACSAKRALPHAHSQRGKAHSFTRRRLDTPFEAAGDVLGDPHPRRSFTLVPLFLKRQIRRMKTVLVFQSQFLWKRDTKGPREDTVSSTKLLAPSSKNARLCSISSTRHRVWDSNFTRRNKAIGRSAIFEAFSSLGIHTPRGGAQF